MEPGVINNLEHHDVWQWLGGGWFMYDGQPAQLVDTGEDDSDYEIRTVDGEYDTLDRSKVVPTWPRCGAVNVPEYHCAVNVIRTQQRQYRRTYNQRCLSLRVPRRWDAAKNCLKVRMATPDSPEVVRAVFSARYPTYAEAESRLGGKWISVALNPHLVIAGPVDEQLVYYRTKLVGVIEDGQMRPFDESPARLRRLLKWFDGRVRL